VLHQNENVTAVATVCSVPEILTVVVPNVAAVAPVCLVSEIVTPQPTENPAGARAKAVDHQRNRTQRTI
jgi:hypothetical protein